MHLLYVPCPSHEVAVDIAKKLLSQKLIACANISKEVTSLFWWEGKVQESQEVLLWLKAPSTINIKTLESNLTALHPYETPAILHFTPSCNAPFKEWLEVSVG